MVFHFMRLLGASFVLFGIVLTSDLQTAHAKKGQGAVNSERPHLGNKYNVWRGKTHEKPKPGHVVGSIVYVYEQGTGANTKLMAKIFLYQAKKKPGQTNDHKLDLLETHEGELRSRLPGPGNGHGKNRELNLLFDAAVENAPGLRRRIILTVSRPPVGPPHAAERSMRLVTSTYGSAANGPEPALEPKPVSDPGCGNDATDEVKPTSGIESKSSSVALGCSDYPDDAVMIEETISAIDGHGTPDPNDPWMDYPETEWDEWEEWP